MVSNNSKSETPRKPSESRVDTVERAARAGGNAALRLFRDRFDVETKDGKTDVVTSADIESQRRIIESIREDYSDGEIVGEEEDELKQVPDSGDSWVIDPIDGTNNYVRGIRYWTTSVAYARDSEAVSAVNYLPALDDIYVADPDGVKMNGNDVSVSDVSDPEKFKVVPTIWWDYDRRDEYARATEEIVKRFGDLLRFGSAQIILSLISRGALEGTITNVDVNPWDSVAGVYMVRQAGGKVTDIHGDYWTPGSEGLVASNGQAHDELLDAAQSILEK